MYSEGKRKGLFKRPFFVDWFNILLFYNICFPYVHSITQCANEFFNNMQIKNYISWKKSRFHISELQS